MLLARLWHESRRAILQRSEMISTHCPCLHSPERDRVQRLLTFTAVDVAAGGFSPDCADGLPDVSWSTAASEAGPLGPATWRACKTRGTLRHQNTQVRMVLVVFTKIGQFAQPDIASDSADR